MSTGRALLVLGLAAGVAAPLVLPAAGLLGHPGGWSALAEAGRFGPLLLHTLALAGGAVLIAVPAGAIAAVLIERTRLPGSHLLRALVAVGLFIPLPVYAAAWQAALGGSGVLPDAGGWRPWRQGLLPAVWVHAAAGLPWVVWVVSLGLRTTDPRLEEEALLAGGPRAVLRSVVVPRVRVSAAAAGCWVGVQALTEVAVTDVLMVRTFAEEVYFQLVGNPDGVSAAVAVTVPVWALAAAGALWLARRWAGRFPAAGAELRAARRFRLGRWGELVVAAGLWGGVAFLVGLPIAALVSKVGSLEQLGRVVRVHGLTLADSLLWSAVAGLVAAGLALPACWWARGSRRAAGFVLSLSTFAWVTPAPLVGLGLKQAIDRLLAAEEAVLAALGLDPAFPPLRSLLYDQPSPAPAVWAAVVRFFPVAVAILWPVVRRVPRELLDAARLDGGPRAEWRGVVWPSARPGFVRAAAAVGVLALGEVVASKLVQPPGRQSFAQELFNAMHYGADATVAAMCLLQIAATALACGGFLPHRGDGARNG